MVDKKITRNIKNDEYWMKKALKLAEKARDLDEVPVGAIIVSQGKIVGRGYNLREQKISPTAHAEIMAIEKAAKKMKNWRLLGVTLYVTLEPCAMCAGALVHARVDRVVFGASDPKAGALESVYKIGSDDKLNHKFTIEKGILAAECSQILKDFFKQKRRKK